MTQGRLGAIRDGVELPEEAARALWRAFSEHMERNEDDFDGFARDHGFVRVRAEHRRGRAVLVISSMASMPPPGLSGSSRSRSAARPGTRKADVAAEPRARASGSRKR